MTLLLQVLAIALGGAGLECGQLEFVGKDLWRELVTEGLQDLKFLTLRQAAGGKLGVLKIT